ncbi:MAG TPA: cytochrome c [Bacteroidota bacterium]|nr:cytochrome c [Bacteroidota bacterium]
MKFSRLLTLLSFLLLVGCGVKRDTGGSSPNVDSTQSAVSPGPAAPVISYEERQGRVLYEKYCLVCHGKEGRGDGFNAYNLDPHPRDFSDSTYMAALSDAQIVRTISGGGRSVNKSPLMPAYGWTIDKADLSYIASYIRTFAGRQ